MTINRNRQRVRFLPYKMTSKSAKVLSKSMNLLRLYPDARSRFKGRHEDIIINWGTSFFPSNLGRVTHWVNHPSAVATASNKLSCFYALESASDVQIPEFTASREKALEWLREGDTDIVCRKYLKANSGRGITIIKKDEDETAMPYVPLYVKYVSKQKEYRAHVLPTGEVILREKRRRIDCPDEQVNWQIRSHNNGFIFAKNLSYEPSGIKEMAKAAIEAIGLDFGALDIIYNANEDKCYILEINTAPGLVNSTIDIYKEAFETCINDIRGRI